MGGQRNMVKEPSTGKKQAEKAKAPFGILSPTKKLTEPLKALVDSSLREEQNSKEVLRALKSISVEIATSTESLEKIAQRLEALEQATLRD